MIRRALEALERLGAAEAQLGLDASGDVAWRASGSDVLGTVGAWQEWLRASGVRAGDRVAIDLPRGPDLLPAHLAVLALGATVVPLSPALAPRERAQVLARAEPRALLDAGARAGAPRAPALADHADAPALLVFTSGTTGEPKGVPHAESGIEANLADLERVWGLGPHDRILHSLPAHHVHGLVLALYGSARLGIPITWLERFDAALCLEALARHAQTLFMGVPTMYHRFAHAPHVPDLSRMRLFTCGSAPLSADDFRAFETRLGFAPVERYGLTETLIVASNPLVGERRPGAVGLALPQTEVALASDGEILVRGPAVTSGYWRAPETSTEAFHDGFFRTGDLGHRDADGYLVISGRKKELIIVGGSNVLPGEVEAALGAEPGVEEIAAAGVPDADRGEVVALFVVAKPGESEPAVEKRLRARADAGLAAYKRPRLYRFVASLPRNAMGKLDRKGLARL